MRTKLFFCATASVLAFGLTSCDEDNDQLIDLDRGDERVLVASNTTAKLAKFTTDDLNEPERIDITVPYMDGDGIGLRGDDLFAANRSGMKLHLLDDVFDDDNEDNVSVETTSDEEISNQRGVAVNREFTGALVAVASAGNADNGNRNRIYLFKGERSDLDLEAVVEVDFQLWGLEWDGDRLLAVMDTTNSVAVFEDFDDATSTDSAAFRQPDFTFEVEGLTRTHGIAFDSDDDILFLTDIGDAGSDSDGAVHVVTNWDAAARSAARDGVLELSRQARIAGSGTFLGNPVDVGYDNANNFLFVAERAASGGLVIGFDMENISDNNGNTVALAPIFRQNVAGASSIEVKN